MNWKKVVGILLAVIGVVLVVFSSYIASQVAAGQQQIEEGQSKVNTINQVFSVSPATKQVGKGLTNSGQERINAGKEEVARYAAMAGNLRVGGIILIVLGAGFFYFGRNKRS